MTIDKNPTTPLTDADFREKLTPEQYRVLREKGTERAFTGDLWDEHRPGLYLCAGCDAELFPSGTKFESGTGWPSFYAPVAPDAVATETDRSMWMTRVEALCRVRRASRPRLRRRAQPDRAALLHQLGVAQVRARGLGRRRTFGGRLAADRIASMTNDDGVFDEQVASTYDDPSDPMFDLTVIEPTVDLLAELAGAGRALELGIGTGRIALPLAARGVDVHGIDLSRAMTDRLRAKPGGQGIGLTLGDYSTATIDGTFRLAYLVFNTIMNVTTQAGQVATFRNVAAHLEPGGVFVIEVGVPDLRRLPPGERFVVFDGSETHWGVDEYDVANQGLISHHFDVRGDQVRKSQGPFRYVWPAELRPDGELAGCAPRPRPCAGAPHPGRSVCSIQSRSAESARDPGGHLCARPGRRTWRRRPCAGSCPCPWPPSSRSPRHRPRWQPRRRTCGIVSPPAGVRGR